MSRLLERTRALLEFSAVPLEQIAIESGLPYHWLMSFKYRPETRPSVDRVEKLYVFLSGRPLGLDTDA